MPITIEDRYKNAFEQLRFASEMRFKIFAAWGSVYLALAAMFAWMQSTHASRLSWIVPLLGIVATVMFWFADSRNQPAIGAAKTAGSAIEAAAEIPEQQRYFSQLEKGVPFRWIVNTFAALVFVALIGATCVLLKNPELLS